MKSFYKKKSKSMSLILSNKYQGHLLIKKAIQHTLNKLATVSILDLGCGTGSLASFLRSYARTLHGVDLSPDMLIQATKTGLYDCLYEQDLELYLGETPHHYDMIVAAAVMIHFFDLEAVFSMIQNKLKPNGTFIFSVFEGTEKNSELNSFFMYSHSDYYIINLADRLNFKICYQNQGIHEYHKEIPVNALIYVLKKQHEA
jgi:predicted TPR repeat methyltransferase